MIEKGEFKHVGVLWSIIGKSMPHFCDIMLILRWKMMEIEMSLTSKLFSKGLTDTLLK